MNSFAKLSVMTLIALFSSLVVADKHNHGKHASLLTACKAECPTANTEEEADQCVMKLIAAKKIKKGNACFAAHEEHEKHEAKKDNHGDHKH